MNFAYIDAAALIESVLQEPEPPLVPLPVELPEKWKKFENVLGEFKLDYVKKRRELTDNLAKLDDKKKDLRIIKTSLNGCSNQDLKTLIENILDNYEHDEGITDLTRKCRELQGEVNEMQTILINTMPEKYAKFTCFVCTDNLVDLFIDPCGHVICDTCWNRSSLRSGNCPACRSRVASIKRIYTM
jgi:Prokaryotic RING finger family 4